ncbi:methyltransferase domain-containing protein [Aliikangiella sp. IMCC44359]|uniref:methyltransferase domain-containing protein n=1 Tax=Aliikangiella sp. IMCC44359 TaxID=3459125 RepID=UPI00403AA7FD
MSSLTKKIIDKGLLWTIKAVFRFVIRKIFLLKNIFAEPYHNPTADELKQIENQLNELGIKPQDYQVPAQAFNQFKRTFQFPEDYHGGIQSGVWDEKHLEHFVALDILNLDSPESYPYIDIASCESPWAKMLKAQGNNAYSIDLVKSEKYADLDYYLQGDATQTAFESASISSASLQCAFEMFIQDNDTKLIKELSRILKVGGKVVISPLYTHLIPCYYQTPDYYGKDFGDEGAKRLIRRDCWGVAASRKYSADTLKSRVWDVAVKYGLTPKLLVLRNKSELGDNIYLHFILVIEKTDELTTND